MLKNNLQSNWDGQKARQKPRAYNSSSLMYDENELMPTDRLSGGKSMVVAVSNSYGGKGGDGESSELPSLKVNFAYYGNI